MVLQLLVQNSAWLFTVFNIACEVLACHWFMVFCFANTTGCGNGIAYLMLLCLRQIKVAFQFIRLSLKAMVWLFCITAKWHNAKLSYVTTSAVRISSSSLSTKNKNKWWKPQITFCSAASSFLKYLATAHISKKYDTLYHNKKVSSLTVKENTQLHFVFNNEL